MARPYRSHLRLDRFVKFKPLPLADLIWWLRVQSVYARSINCSFAAPMNDTRNDTRLEPVPLPARTSSTHAVLVPVAIVFTAYGARTGAVV